MKLMLVFFFVFLFCGTSGVLAQNSVFGWETLTNPPFPTQDSVTLTASTNVFTNFPIIPGYNNQNSLTVDITDNGTGYCFIKKIFPEPITIPTWCYFVTNMPTPTLSISIIFKYQGIWYAPGTGKTNLSENWYYTVNNFWFDWVQGSNIYPLDYITLDTVYLYLQYPQSMTVTFDTWFYRDSLQNPELICGYGDQLSGLENIDSQTPSNYSLLQNYPNPFNPNTKIQFTIPATSNVCLDIYNALGQKIKTLVNEELVVGTYEYDFNADDLPSGNYFYTLTTTEGYIITKKMTLLK